MHLQARIRQLLVVFLVSAATLLAQQAPNPLAPYLKETAPVIVLDHVRIIDGTGSASQEDMRIDIAGSRITRVQSARLRNAYPPDAKVLDLTGRTVIPGLVGMHEHLFYTTPDRPKDGLFFFGEMPDSAPRLYLAGGVTTARTTGSMEPYTDLALKEKIDAGKLPGPKLHITGPYLGGLLGLAPQLHTLTGPGDAARTVDYWAAEGVTSFKAYMDITPEELKAAIDHAHAKGLKMTGHLCAVGFKEAAALGIDNLEHGLAVDTEFFPGKKPGICPDFQAVEEDLVKNVNVDGPQVQEMIHDLVAHHVAVTSTLAVFETSVPNRPPLARVMGALDTLTPEAREYFYRVRARIAEDVNGAAVDSGLLKKEMQFERSFVKAGGLLLAGCDPTGYGGVVPGFGDQRGIELLVEAGFTPVEAIQIATSNGAKFLGEDSTIGTVAAGKAADLVVLNGNPAAQIDDIEKVETVFKDGVGYDPAQLVESVRGLVGLR
jgi:imidazolonepropionase-like amidohydrolase